ncbi:MAG: asparagine synthase (glutamine-hydrolyzing) [Desulfobacterales bacterium]
MCGICGIYHRDSQPVERNHVETMNSMMLHRGPDGEGIHTDTCIGLGHRRLSIIDLEAGKQPMSNADGSIQVVFNGEIYNFLELKKILEAKGFRFRTRSDTESIIYAYEQWGESFAEKLRGMFAIALWDARKQKLILLRDRVGKKPLYYFCDQNCLIFASELKALTAIPGIPKEMDFHALDAYLSFGYVPSPMSIFRHIRKLPPAHLAVCTSEKFSIRPYWELDMNHSTDPEDENTVAEELKAIFDESVKLRLMSDVPLGAFLSGGVDSSAVVASMSLLMGKEPVKTASIGFSEKKFDELAYARMVAKQYHTDHTEFVVKPDALSVLEKIVWHLDEPFADASAIPTYYVSQMARRKVTVALSGDGGDETFAGYVNRYYMNRVEAGIRDRIPLSVRQHIIKPLSEIWPQVDTLPRALRLKKFLCSLSCSFEEAYFRNMSFYFLPEMKTRLYRPELAAQVRDFSAFDVLGPHFQKNQNPDVTTRAQYVDIKTYMTEDILVKVDRMSMAHSLEVRSPILDHKLMEFAGQLPSRLKLNGRESKYIFKKMNEKRLPADILYRKKQGFSIPLAAWMRGELKEFAADTLFSSHSVLKEYFHTDYVKDLWNRHQGGKQDFATPLWGLMMLGLWHREFV